MASDCMLAIFAKYPIPGDVKTRLAADIGDDAACALYRSCVEKILSTGREWAANSPHQIRLYATDEQYDRWHNWLGENITCRTQTGSDLGSRMHNALCEGLEEGFDRAICVGTDVPGLSTRILNHADEKLITGDAVVGPARDGGYYLIGIKQPAPQLFDNIAWSTSDVLSTTEAQARASGISMSRVSVLNDIDTTADLWGGAGAVSVVIPTLNEAEDIARTVRKALQLGPHEVIVADGGSSDRTVDNAKTAGARVVSSRCGRGTQLNAGAEAATGTTLLFLHADCCPPALSLWYIGQVLQESDVVGGAFELKLDRTTPWLRVVEMTANWRSYLWGKPYGDQGVFVRKDVFEQIGGFPDWPLMEDVELARRLRQAGTIQIIPRPVIASARKWEKGGILRTYLIMKLTQWGYYLGASPESLSRFYERGTRR